MVGKPMPITPLTKPATAKTAPTKNQTYPAISMGQRWPQPAIRTMRKVLALPQAWPKARLAV
jgi:hypothetical protein